MVGFGRKNVFARPGPKADLDPTKNNSGLLPMSRHTLVGGLMSASADLTPAAARTLTSAASAPATTVVMIASIAPRIAPMFLPRLIDLQVKSFNDWHPICDRFIQRL